MNLINNVLSGKDKRTVDLRRRLREQAEFCVHFTEQASTVFTFLSLAIVRSTGILSLSAHSEGEEEKIGK